MLEKMKAVMLGHAVGDALGVPVEFCSREELETDPVTDMRGYGTYPVPPGAWSDDTALSLAALDTLGKKEWSFFEVMVNFAAWFEKGKYTSTGRVFDVGRTCSAAILDFIWDTYIVELGQFVRPNEAYRAGHCGRKDERSNGNGSLMRIHPFVLYAKAKQLPFDSWRKLIETASALTHAHERSRVGCLIYAFVLMQLLEKPSKAAIERGLRQAERLLCDNKEIAHYQRLLDPDFAKIPRNGIRSSGYVVDTLEAALWCLLTTDNYRECVLKAVNLGEDTDTVAAVAGGLAAALYGYDAIPKEWLGTLLRCAYIERLCKRAVVAEGRMIAEELSE